MNRLGILLIAAALAAMSAAQGMRTPMGVPAKEFMLLRKEVQDELKLTDAQRKAVADAAGDSARMDGGRVRISVRPGQDLGSIAGNLGKTLQPTQRERLTELWIQQNGALTLSDPDIQKKLKLSSTQKAKIDDLVASFAQGITELMSSSGGRVSADDSAELRKETQRKLAGVLNSNQAKSFEAMKGKPFAAIKQ